MGRASRDKGARAERAIVRALQDAGFASERVPLSGAARGRFGGDVSVPLLGVDRRVEVKARANGFRQLYDWLAGADFLIVRADRREPLVVLPLKLAIEIATVAECAKNTPLTVGREAMTHRLQRNQTEFSRDDEPGVSVRLLIPDDLDLLGPLNDGAVTVACAREIVAERRLNEEHERREEAYEKHRADLKEARDEEFGK